MDKIIFNNNEKICIYKDGEITEFQSDFFNKYISTSIRQAEADEWKTTGFGAQFRGDAIQNLRNSQNDEEVRVSYTGLSFLDDNTILYSILLNNLSAVYTKDLTAKKDGEGHVIHSNQQIYKGCSICGNKIAFTVLDNPVTSHVAIFDRNTDDYETITDGDCADETPVFSKKYPNEIIFSSKGVGRDSSMNFVKYSPSSIYHYNLDSGEVSEIYSSDNFSYVSPKDDENGNLYCIKRPSEFKNKNENIFVDILLIPVKIVKAIYYFLESFTRMFTGENFTEKSSGDIKKNNKNPTQIFIDGNEIYADKEYKTNLKHKDEIAGIIPRSFELIKISNGKEEVLAKGVIAFEILSDKSIVYSNGKHLILLKDGVKTKLCTSNLITQLSSKA